MQLPTLLDGWEEEPAAAHSPKEKANEDNQTATAGWVDERISGHRVRCDARKATASLRLWIAAGIGALAVLGIAGIIAYYSVEAVIYKQTKAVVVEVTPEIVRKVVRQELEGRIVVKAMPETPTNIVKGWSVFPRALGETK